MSAKILQLNFRFGVTRTEYEQLLAPLVSDFADVPGLVWKIWLMNEADREAGGIYLFEDGSSLDAYLDGPLAGTVTSHPALSDMQAKTFDVIEDLTSVTRGPVQTAGAA